MYRPPRALLRKRTRLFLRTLMLVVGVLGMPSAGQAVVNGSHCVRHDVSASQPAHTGDMHQMAGTHAAWQDASSHTCPHCPASECARIAPCAGGGASALVAAAPELGAPAAGRSRTSVTDDRARSALPRPTTPPPVLIA